MTCQGNCDHPRVTLLDGTEVCTWSEGWRHQCEAMAVCRMPTLAQRRRYLLLIHDKRGRDAWLQLRDTVARIWEAARERPAGGGE